MTRALEIRVDCVLRSRKPRDPALRGRVLSTVLLPAKIEMANLVKKEGKTGREGQTRLIAVPD